jgi:hypothetical protein
MNAFELIRQMGAVLEVLSGGLKVNVALRQ